MNDFDEAYEDEEAMFGEPYPDLLAFFEDLPPGRVLDLGSGQGRNAVALALLGHDVTAVDSSAVGIRQSEEAAARLGAAVTGIVADLADLDIEGRYDVVLADMVLHALDDDVRRRLLAGIVEAVVPGGVTYVLLPVDGRRLRHVPAAVARPTGGDGQELVGPGVLAGPQLVLDRLDGGGPRLEGGQGVVEHLAPLGYDHVGDASRHHGLHDAGEQS
ncbi:MAG: methyltransferase domain-containing protein, partial [Actinomycetota bacterium]